MKNLIVIFLVFASSLVSAQWTMKGQVKDTYSKKNVKNVVITHTHDGEVTEVTTNKKGKFKVEIQDTLDVITFSKEGYFDEKMVVGNAKKVSVGLTKKDNEYERATVTDSYGTMNKKSFTGAVTVLKTKDFNQGAVTDIYQLLRGKVPGLMIRHDSQSPNSEPTVMLRGMGTGSRAIPPMIVVDGNSNFALSNVDPNDVKTVQVLRDGSASAMYGSQAMGGVIIITTKTN